MSFSPRTARRLLTVGVVSVAAFTGAAAPAEASAPGPATTPGPAAPQSPAAPGAGSASTAASPDLVSLLSEYEQYWTPTPYDKSTPQAKQATAWHGSVTPAGVPVLSQNDETLLAINSKGQADQQQSRRALVDADLEWESTVADSLGPKLGSYFTRGVEEGKLPLTKASMDAIQASSSTGKAKGHFNYPRPFLPDRSFGGKSDLQGMTPSLDIHRVQDWTDSSGKKHSAEYQHMTDGYSQAFPSGHTTFAYEAGLQLAMLVPELGPEALTRSSEAGNNRIVLGVHYPLDVMGGRIAGHANAAARYADPAYDSTVLTPARNELRSYLSQQCSRDGLGDTLERCIQNTKADDAGGYRNDFTDVASTVPVTDRASALTAYRSRMSYGFDGQTARGQTARVPADAEDLLLTAFPQLNEAQRRAVLAATEIDSGDALDSSSEGWERIDLPAAMSSRVTLDAQGNVVAVEPGQRQASVVSQA